MSRQSAPIEPVTSPAPRWDPALVRAADVMSAPVVTLSSNDTLAAAWNLLLRGHVHHLVVIEDSGRVAGVVDDRRLALEWPIGPLGPHRRRLHELLPPNVHCVLPTTPVRVVAETMTHERLDATPVVLEDGTLVGIVTSGDIVAFVAKVTVAGR